MEEDRILQLRQDLLKIQEARHLSDTQRKEQIQQLERKLNDELRFLTAGRPLPGHARKAPGRAPARTDEKEADPVQIRQRKNQQQQKKKGPVQNLSPEKPIARPMSNHTIIETAHRTEFFVYAGVLVFVVIVAILGFYASKQWKPSRQTVPFMNAETLKAIQWSPDLDVAGNILNEEKPVLLNNTVVTLWPAFGKWTFEYLAAKNPLLEEIYQSKNPGFQHYTYDKPMEKFFGLAPKFKIFDAPAKAFLELFNTTSDYLYWSGAAEDIKVLDDLQPLGPLAIDKEPVSTNVWISSKGVIALLHYDLYHNCFVQLKGRKKFTLFPPSNYKYLYLHPLHHPAHRQSQVNLQEPDFKLFPLLRLAKPIEVIVEEGQVLFLPPMWLHQVEALDHSISVNVWSYDEGIRDVNEILFLSLPFSENWSQQKLYDAVRVYITMLVEHYQGPSSVRDFVQNLVQTRFKTLDPNHLKKFVGPQDQKFCSPTLDETPFRGELKKGITQLRKYLDPVPKEVRMVVIEDYIQDLVLFSLGLERVLGFLEACFPL